MKQYTITAVKEYEYTKTVFAENLVDAHQIDGVGHWVQEEKPQEVNDFLLNFLETIKS